MIGEGRNVKYGEGRGRGKKKNYLSRLLIPTYFYPFIVGVKGYFCA
jgi:hypothetical protein